MTRRNRSLYPNRNHMVKGWWKLAAAARYLQQVKEASSVEIISNARAQSGASIDLNPRELSGRMRRHPSFKSEKPEGSNSNPVLWRIVNDDIFMENPNKRGK